MSVFSKRFYFLSSLLFAVALFLGLAVTGCSDSDRERTTPVETETVLNIKIGLQGKDTLVKGFDCDKNTSLFGVFLYDKDNNALESRHFASSASESGEIEAWTEQEDGSYLMRYVVNNKNVASVNKFIVNACDDSRKVYGSYCWDNLELTVGEPKNCDFTDDNAPAFQTEDSFRFTIDLTSEPAAKEGVITIAEGETITISAKGIVEFSETTKISYILDTNDFSLTSESAPEFIKIEPGDMEPEGYVATYVITGVKAGENLEVVADGEKVKEPVTFKVTVTGGGTAEFTAELDNPAIYIDETAKITAKYDGQVVTDNLTYKSGDENVATVDTTGQVKGVAKGNTTITVKYKTSAGIEVSKDVDIAVKDHTFSVSLMPSTIAVGGTSDIYAYFDNEYVSAEKYKLNDDEWTHCTKVSNERVQGLSAGTDSIKVTYEYNGKAYSDSATLTVE